MMYKSDYSKATLNNALTALERSINKSIKSGNLRRVIDLTEAYELIAKHTPRVYHDIKRSSAIRLGNHIIITRKADNENIEEETTP